MILRGINQSDHKLVLGEKIQTVVPVLAPSTLSATLRALSPFFFPIKGLNLLLFSSQCFGGNITPTNMFIFPGIPPNPLPLKLGKSEKISKGAAYLKRVFQLVNSRRFKSCMYRD